MSDETEDGIGEELFDDLEARAEAERIIEDEPEESNAAAGKENTTEEKPELDIGKQALLEHSRGKPEDWQLEHKGDSGYRFDGEVVRNPEGNEWGQGDKSLDRETLESLKEAFEDKRSEVIFLPEYTERTEDKETLYVTMLILGEKGGLTYEIHKHETPLSKEEEAYSEFERTEMPERELAYELSEDIQAQEIGYPVGEVEHLQETAAATEVAREEVSVREVLAGGVAATESIMDARAASDDKTETEGHTPDAWLVDLLGTEPLEVTEDVPEARADTREEIVEASHSAPIEVSQQTSAEPRVPFEDTVRSVPQENQREENIFAFETSRLVEEHRDTVSEQTPQESLGNERANETVEIHAPIDVSPSDMQSAVEAAVSETISREAADGIGSATAEHSATITAAQERYAGEYQAVLSAVTAEPTTLSRESFGDFSMSENADNRSESAAFSEIRSTEDERAVSESVQENSPRAEALPDPTREETDAKRSAETILKTVGMPLPSRSRLEETIRSASQIPRMSPATHNQTSLPKTRTAPSRSRRITRDGVSMEMAA